MTRPQELTQELLDKTKQVNSTRSSSAFNLTNTIIGAGVLAIPYAFMCAGIVGGLIVLLLVWMSSSYSFMLLSYCAEITGQFSFKKIANVTYGQKVAVLSESCILLYTFGNLIARLIIIGDCIPVVLQHIAGTDEHYFFTGRSFLMIIISCGLILPLTLLRNIDSLRMSSLFALMCIVYVMALVVAEFVYHSVHGTIDHTSLVFLPSSFSFFVAFPILVVSFCAHYNIMRLYFELKDPSVARITPVIWTSTTVCFISYIVTGLFGYMVFRDETDGNILKSYSQSAVGPSIARVCLSIAVALSYPLVNYACRNAIFNLFMTRDQENRPGVYELVTASIVGLSLLVAIYVPDITTVFAFMGSTVGVVFVYVLPGLLYVRVRSAICTSQAAYTSVANPIGHDDTESALEDPHECHLEVEANNMPSARGAYSLVAFGVVVGVVGTTVTVLRLVDVLP